MLGLVKKIFGDANEREIKRLMRTVDEINALEPQISQLSDEALRAKTDEFKALLEKGEDLDNLLPEAFAVVREASKRVLDKRHYDVQLIGGMVLHEGQIAEMKTGEGKTLVATLPVYLNALLGKGVHVVTVNDYLAQRDSEQMGQIYEFLGMTVGLICMVCPMKRSKQLMLAILLMERTMNSVSITCVTTWCCTKNRWCSVRFILRSSMKWIPFWSMKRVRRLLFPDKLRNRQSCIMRQTVL